MWWNQIDEKDLKISVPDIADDAPSLVLQSNDGRSKCGGNLQKHKLQQQQQQQPLNMTPTSLKESDDINGSKKDKKKTHRRRKSDKIGIARTPSISDSTSINDSKKSKKR